MLSMRRARHWLIMTLSSISATLSQLPCLGKTYPSVEVGERQLGHLDLLKEQGGEIKGEKIGEIGGFGIVAEAWDSKDAGHPLAETLEQAAILSGVSAKRCYVGRGYKGVEISWVRVFRSGQRRGVSTRVLKRELKRRSAIEELVGRMKTDGRMDRCRG